MLGYVLSQDLGKEIVPEAVKAVLNYAFTDLDIWYQSTTIPLTKGQSGLLKNVVSHTKEPLGIVSKYLAEKFMIWYAIP